MAVAFKVLRVRAGSDQFAAWPEYPRVRDMIVDDIR